MSELHQSGLHPDADQLNALVEHALPPHEREQTLAHLAECATCRAVVSLSLPPADEAPRPQAAPVRRPWFLGWNLAWPVAAAFAALVPLVLYVHRTETARSRAAAPAEIAESQPAPPPLAPPASAPMLAGKAPSPHVPMEKSAGPPAAAASPSAKRPELVAPPPAPTASAQIVPSGAAVASPNPPAGTPQPPAAIPGTARFSAGLGALRGSRPAAPAPGNSGIYAGAGQANLNENSVDEIPAAPPSLPPPAAATSAGAAVAATQTVTVTNAPPMLDASDAAFGALALRASAPEAPLPSGLPALSTASRGGLALALDTANTLFISDDGGRRWKPVPAKWKGRAVSVKLATAPAALGRGAAQAAGAGRGGFAAGALAGTPRQDSGVNSGVAGTVTDPTGAVIPNATVAVIDAAGQVVRNTETGPDGRYRMDGPTPGSYTLQARAPGFQRLDVPVTLAASQPSLANLTLQVGAATEAVTVTAAPQIEIDESALSQSQKKALAAPIQPAPLFEITTESGERWISPDGQTWARRP